MASSGFYNGGLGQNGSPSNGYAMSPIMPPGMAQMMAAQQAGFIPPPYYQAQPQQQFQMGYSENYENFEENG